ncbi:MAG: type II toxin-antitoxin system HicA family toxin [Patescibacteria group bacterium]
MTSSEKLLRKFLDNPSSVRYGQIEKILSKLGFIKIYTKGSHVKFKHSQLRRDIVVPVHNNECKDFYKNEVAKVVRKIV